MSRSLASWPRADLWLPRANAATPIGTSIGVVDRKQWEIGAGLVPGGGPMARLPRLIGRGRALEVLLSGEDIPLMARIIAVADAFDSMTTTRRG